MAGAPKRAPAWQARKIMLEVRDLRVYHGLVEAVHGISFTVEEGSCVGLLGPNGAGKTSTISALAGIVRCKGSIAFMDRDISSMPVEDRVRAGISVAPEGRRVFGNLTVEENLTLGTGARNDSAEAKIDVENWLSEFPVLRERRRQLAGTLSGGEQQMLTIARCLVSRPRILLLDEPSLGLAPKICTQVFDLIARLKNSGMTILLVEQNAREALRLADFAYVLNSGILAAKGDAELLGGDRELMLQLTGVG